MKKYNFNTLPKLMKDNEFLLRTNIVEKKFLYLRDKICKRFQDLENEYSEKNGLKKGIFKKNSWKRSINRNEY